ncbi:MAG: glycosyltransferase family 2 protein [Magnetococcales bacterium]|nr:glycosyltransferase family 2 protein [Magnetococcales bacterium]
MQTDKPIGKKPKAVTTPAGALPPLVIIPAYNEEVAIGRVVSRLLELGFHVVVVDDCSKDNTIKVAEKAGATVLRHPTNLGYGCALQTGYLYALEKNYQRVVQADGDGQHEPDSALDLIRVMEEKNVDVVIGSRFLHPLNYQAPRLRRMGQHFFSYMVNITTGMGITDPTSGFQALSLDVIKFYCTRVFPDDYPDANILMLLHRKRFRVTETAVRMYPSSSGSMHSGFFNPIYYVIRMNFSMFMSRLVKLTGEKQR